MSFRDFGGQMAPTGIDTRTGAGGGGATNGTRYQGLGYTNNPDPFAYTGGSLLTPWTQELPDLPQGGFSSGYADPGGFKYQDLNYSFARPADITAERVSAPDKFQRGEFGGVQDFQHGSYDPAAMASYQNFKAPTLDETNDPGYAFRLAEAQRAIQNTASAQGIRGGDVAKALQDYSQNYASAEYDKVWNRAFGAHNQDFANQFQTQAFNEANRGQAFDRNFNVASGVYDRNRSNAFDTYNMNFQNQMAAADMNNRYSQQAQMANQQAALQAAMSNQQTQLGSANLGWDVASGSWDRNYQNALNSYNIDAQRAQSAASAGAAAQRDQYNAEMARYGLAYDMFQNNQNNQFNRLYMMSGIGQGAANAMTNAAGQYGQDLSSLYMGGANAQGQGYMNSANAWGGAVDGIANGIGTGLVLGSPYSPFGASGRGAATNGGSWTGV